MHLCRANRVGWAKHIRTPRNTRRAGPSHRTQQCAHTLINTRSNSPTYRSVVLGVGMNQVEVDVARLGGGFGGKEDQASGWGAMAALVAFVLKKPAKMCCIAWRICGSLERNPYSSDYKIGFDANHRILAYQATFYQTGCCWFIAGYIL